MVNINPNVRINVRTSGELPAEIRDANPELLAKILRTDSSAQVRRVAAWGLHDHADVPVAFSALSQAAERDADGDVRTMAVWALEGSRDSKVTELLGRVLARDSDAEAREMAAWALGQFADPSAAEPLAAALAKEASDRTLGTIAWAIGNIPMERAPAKLTALLTNESKHTRLAAAWALSNIADKATLPAIRAALEAAAGRQHHARAAARRDGDGPVTRGTERPAHLVRSGRRVLRPSRRCPARRALIPGRGPGRGRARTLDPRRRRASSGSRVRRLFLALKC
ncbi:MAG: HEAT repeat domain-containing protein [Gemmatimonadales bacterium]